MKQWLFLLLLLFLCQKPSFASSMQNEQFQLDLKEGNVTPTPPVQRAVEPQQTQHTEPETLLISSLFSFSSSDSFIDYGEFIPTEPVIRTFSLNVATKWPYGFYVLGSENHDLKGQTQSIPDTSCDNGACTPTLSSAWTGLLTYGFGFRCESSKDIVCTPYQISSAGFQPFSNLQKDIAPQMLLFSSQGEVNSKANLQLKVNTSKSQAQEIYQNNLQFVAIPKL